MPKKVNVTSLGQLCSMVWYGRRGFSLLVIKTKLMVQMFTMMRHMSVARPMTLFERSRSNLDILSGWLTYSLGIRGFGVYLAQMFTFMRHDGHKNIACRSMSQLCVKSQNLVQLQSRHYVAIGVRFTAFARISFPKT